MNVTVIKCDFTCKEEMDLYFKVLVRSHCQTHMTTGRICRKSPPKTSTFSQVTMRLRILVSDDDSRAPDQVGQRALHRHIVDGGSGHLERRLKPI